MEQDGFDIQAIAQGIAEAGKEEAGEPDAKPLPDVVEPQEPEDGKEERTAKPRIPERDDIEVRKKRSTKPTPEAQDTGDSSEDGEGDEDADFDSEQKPSNNFKKLRESQKKYKRQAEEQARKLEEAQDEIKKLAELKRYRDMYDLENSGEFKAKYAGAREDIIGKAALLAETYGYEKEDVLKAFTAESVRTAKEYLSELTDGDQFATSEIGKHLTDYYSNIVQEQKELANSDPKERLRLIRQEQESRMREKQEVKASQLRAAKTKTQEELTSILKNAGDAKKLWPALYDKSLKKYIETDLQEVLVNKSEESFSAFFDTLADRGAELDFDDTRRLAMLSADAVSSRLSDKVITILLNRLDTMEKQLKRQTGNANPTIREDGSMDSQSSPDGAADRADGLLAAINNLGQNK